MAESSFLRYSTVSKGSWHQEANAYFIYASTEWSGRVYKFDHCGDDNEHISCSKPREIILGGSSGQCDLHTKPMTNEDVGVYYA